MKIINSENVAELTKDKRILIATPMYGGNATGLYTKSMINLAIVLTKLGVQFNFVAQFNESLIPRARNYLVESFLQTDSTHLMFIDADIEFNPIDVVQMLAISDAGSEYDILCGGYPKKSISWEKVVQAVNAGKADSNPNDLEKFIGDFVVNVKRSGDYSLNEPFEISEGGTGFMLIRRDVFIDYAKAYPELHYTPDHVRTPGFDGSKKITAFFDTVIDPDSNRYLSEDYMFCRYANKIGKRIWLCPWINLNHVGSYVFTGNFGAVVTSGMSITVDKSQLKK